MRVSLLTPRKYQNPLSWLCSDPWSFEIHTVKGTKASHTSIIPSYHPKTAYEEGYYVIICHLCHAELTGKVDPPGELTLNLLNLKITVKPLPESSACCP